MQVSLISDQNNGYFTCRPFFFFYELLTVHLSTGLDSDQFDAHLLYFTILALLYNMSVQYYNPLHVSNITYAHPQEPLTVLMQHLVSASQWPSSAQVERELVGVREAD